MKIPIDEHYLLLIGVQDLFVVALLASCSALQFAVRSRLCWRAASGKSRFYLNLLIVAYFLFKLDK